MASRRIEIRNTLRTLTAALPGFSLAVVSLFKIDKIESAPCASVYLADLESEPSAMRGGRDRAQAVTVSLFITHDDAEAKVSELVDLLEVAVENARRADGFTGVTSAHLSAIAFDHDKTSQGTNADAHATFLFTFSETIL